MASETRHLKEFGEVGSDRTFPSVLMMLPFLGLLPRGGKAAGIKPAVPAPSGTDGLQGRILARDGLLEAGGRREGPRGVDNSGRFRLAPKAAEIWLN